MVSAAKMSSFTVDPNLEPKPLLYDSKVCRLCGERNENGRPLYRDCVEGGECEVSKLINQYLPVKVVDDGVLPRWICPGCHIQLESTAQFFEMILKGQEQLAGMREKQQTLSKAVRVDDQLQLYDIMDPDKWNELFEKPDLITSGDKENLLVPIELFELEDLLKPIESVPDQPEPSAPESVETPANQPERTVELEKDEGTDWVVKSEVTVASGGRVIGFVHHNNSKTDIGKLVVVDDTSGRKKIGPQFVCDICSESFAREPRYLMHRKTHSILFECSVCLLKFGSNGKLLVHQQETLHIGRGMVEGLKVPDESGSSRRKGDSKGTVESGTNALAGDNVYACDSCDNTFAGLGTVLQHEGSVHAHENHSFVCIDCGKAFRERNLLYRHRQTHQEDRSHRCTVCTAAFKTRSTLSKHVRSHDDTKRYRCTMCDQQFAYKSGYDKHLNWHNGVKPFECEHCSKRFSQRGNLKEHQRVHSGDKPFRCTICEARFGTSSQHRAHVKRHDAVRPFVCDMCDKTFVLRENYETHLRRHRNEKPYSCEDCPRSFAERWALKKHVRTHTLEKPYSCKHCAKPFADPSNLTRHVVSVHEKKGKEAGQRAVANGGAEPERSTIVWEASNGDAADTVEAVTLSLDETVYMEG
uniref:Uncharacterized protein n=1 Tax=Anopheles farauti TaxID=69004 RepID=A0A182QS20_9DIPT